MHLAALSRTGRMTVFVISPPDPTRQSYRLTVPKPDERFRFFCVEIALSGYHSRGITVEVSTHGVRCRQVNRGESSQSDECHLVVRERHARQAADSGSSTTSNICWCQWCLAAGILLWDLLVRWQEYPAFILPRPGVVWPNFRSFWPMVRSGATRQSPWSRSGWGLLLGLSTALGASAIFWARIAWSIGCWPPTSSPARAFRLWLWLRCWSSGSAAADQQGAGLCADRLLPDADQHHRRHSQRGSRSA